MVTQVGFSMAGRLRGWVTLCAVCTVHVETRNASFLVEPENQVQRFVSGLASKPLGRFLRFGIKTGGDGFSALASKSVATVSRRDGNRWGSGRDRAACFAWKQV
jgi:hypothetical protein